MVQFSIASALLLATSLFASTATAANTAGCGKKSTNVVSGVRKLNVNGVQRKYIVKLPQGYDGKTPKKLIFALHWRYSRMEDVANGVAIQPWYGLESRAKGSAIFVAPDGLDKGWANDNGRDVQFMDAIMKELDAELCIDTTQRFSTGFSYGGAMSFALACARPKVFRAVSVLSAGEVSGCAGGTEPVHYLGIHGTNDGILTFDSGLKLKDRFVQNNGCQAKEVPRPDGKKTKVTRTDYTCTKKKVSFIGYHGGHDNAPLGVNSRLAPDATWKFFTSV